LKIENKSRYLKNRFTDFAEFGMLMHIGFPDLWGKKANFKNSIWRTAVILKIEKIVVSPQQIDRF